MTGRVVEIAAPSRLHFGLFSFGQRDVPPFGGVGLMVRRPELRISIREAERFTPRGALAEEIADTVDRLQDAGWFDEPPRVAIDAPAHPPRHVGLGSGTQLALSVAAGLLRWLGKPPVDAAALAAATGRGRRSGIGVHGFVHGGLIVEDGKRDERALAPLVRRVAVPQAWRFVLARPVGEAGLSGESERAAFERVPPVPRAVSRELRRLALDELAPAAESGQCERFGRALAGYGALAGSCFATVQGGTYATPRVAALVEALQRAGGLGAAQSSWGPTVAGVCVSDESAAAVRAAIEAEFGGTIEATVTVAANQGGEVSDQL